MNRTVLQRFSYAVTVVLTLAVYHPTFKHTARGDQLVYLAEASRTEGKSELLTRFYSYDRTRAYLKGDELLFRPLLWMLLGGETWLFGYAFAAWQAVSLALHLAVLWVLLGLLLDIRAGPGGPVAVCFFSVLLVGSEMVFWHHLQGYLLCLLLLLGVLRWVRRPFAVGEAWKARWAAIVGLSTVACFLYEFAVLVTGLVFVYLMSVNRRNSSLPRWAAVALLAPVVLYVTLSLCDLASRARPAPGRTSEAHLNLGRTPVNLVLAATYWTGAGLLPQLLEVAPGERILMKPALPSDPTILGSLLLLAALGAGAARIGWTLAGRAPPDASNEKAFLLLLAGILAAYGLMLAVGRLNSRGLADTLRLSPYYAYTFWLFLLPLFHGLAASGERREPTRSAACAWVLAAFIIAMNAVSTYRLGEAQARWSGPRNRYVAEVESRLRLGADRAQLLPLASPTALGNEPIRWPAGWTPVEVPPDSLAEILYPRVFHGLPGP